MDADTDLDCREASRLLSASCERELEPNEWTALRHHMAECLMCTNFEKQLKFLNEAARRYGRGD